MISKEDFEEVVHRLYDGWDDALNEQLIQCRSIISVAYWGQDKKMAKMKSASHDRWEEEVMPFEALLQSLLGEVIPDVLIADVELVLYPIEDYMYSEAFRSYGWDVTEGKLVPSTLDGRGTCSEENTRPGWNVY